MGSERLRHRRIRRRARGRGRVRGRHCGGPAVRRGAVLRPRVERQRLVHRGHRDGPRPEVIASQPERRRALHRRERRDRHRRVPGVRRSVRLLPRRKRGVPGVRRSVPLLRRVILLRSVPLLRRVILLRSVPLLRGVPLLDRVSGAHRSGRELGRRDVRRVLTHGGDRIRGRQPGIRIVVEVLRERRLPPACGGPERQHTGEIVRLRSLRRDRPRARAKREHLLRHRRHRERARHRAARIEAAICGAGATRGVCGSGTRIIGSVVSRRRGGASGSGSSTAMAGSRIIGSVPSRGRPAATRIIGSVPSRRSCPVGSEGGAASGGATRIIGSVPSRRGGASPPGLAAEPAELGASSAREVTGKVEIAGTGCGDAGTGCGDAGTGCGDVRTADEPAGTVGKAAGTIGKAAGTASASTRPCTCGIRGGGNASRPVGVVSSAGGSGTGDGRGGLGNIGTVVRGSSCRIGTVVRGSSCGADDRTSRGAPQS